MPHIDMIDSYEDYALVYNRPAGLSVNAAIRRYMGIHDGYEIHLARARYYYHTRTPYFYYWMNRSSVEPQLPEAPITPVAEQKVPDQILPETTEASMKVGDIVVAQDIMVYIDSSSREIDSSSREIVQIKLIDGDRVCAKTLDGSLKIFNLEDLHHIPKNF